MKNIPVYLHAYEAPSHVPAGDSSTAAAHRKIKDEVLLVGIGAYQIFQQGNRFLCCVQAGPLLVRLESQYTARIAFRGDVVPVIVMLPIYLPAVTLAPVVGHYDLAPVPVRFDGVVFGQPVIEHENVLVRFHRHTPGIEKTCRLCLLPDPFITQLFKIGTA